MSESFIIFIFPSNFNLSPEKKKKKKQRQMIFPNHKALCYIKLLVQHYS